MRSLDESLLSPHPLGRMLPGIFLDDDLTQRFTQGLDAVLSSVLCTLDNLDSYFDADLTPEDFLRWLSGWVGLVTDSLHSIPDRRQMIKRVVELYRWRGTAEGLRNHISLVFGITPEIKETGGVSYSPEPRSVGSAFEPAEVVVIVRVQNPAAFQRDVLEAFVEANKPAHVVHRVEVLPILGQPTPASRGRNRSPSSGGAVPMPQRSPYRGYGPVRPEDR